MIARKTLIKILIRGGIGIIPTDTVYGLVGQALKPETVERIYQVRRRNPKKPLIILIQALADLKQFSIRLSKEDHRLLKKYWLPPTRGKTKKPGAISFILPCPSKKFSYLHRGTKTLAFRLPQVASLRKLLLATGPLVAPSANPEGQPVAKTVSEAKRYFTATIDFYAGAKRKRQTELPSTIVRLVNGRLKVIRQGQVNITDL
jgi:L-threonylcarbamoyladenylate synthase